jgi:hypothetical protein
MTRDEIIAAARAAVDAEEAAGVPRTIADPKVLADLARIVRDALDRAPR